MFFVDWNLVRRRSIQLAVAIFVGMLLGYLIGGRHRGIPYWGRLPPDCVAVFQQWDWLIEKMRQNPEISQASIEVQMKRKNAMQQKFKWYRATKEEKSSSCHAYQAVLRGSLEKVSKVKGEQVQEYFPSKFVPICTTSLLCVRETLQKPNL